MKELISFRIAKEYIDNIDLMALEYGCTRSKMVCIIIQYFFDNIKEV